MKNGRLRSIFNVNYPYQIHDYDVGFLPKGRLPMLFTDRSYVQAIGFVPRPAGQILGTII